LTCAARGQHFTIKINLRVIGPRTLLTRCGDEPLRVISPATVKGLLG
jgi:hypothetical protein